MTRRERGLEYCICESCAPSDLDDHFVGGHMAGGDPVPGTVPLSEGEVCTHMHFYTDSCRTCVQGTHAAFLPDWQGVEDVYHRRRFPRGSAQRKGQVDAYVSHEERMPRSTRILIHHAQPTPADSTDLLRQWKDESGLLTNRILPLRVRTWQESESTPKSEAAGRRFRLRAASCEPREAAVETARVVASSSRTRATAQNRASGRTVSGVAGLPPISFETGISPTRTRTRPTAANDNDVDDDLQRCFKRYKRALENQVRSLLELERRSRQTLSSPGLVITSPQLVTAKTEENGSSSIADAPHTNRDEFQLDTKGKNPELQ